MDLPLADHTMAQSRKGAAYRKTFLLRSAIVLQTRPLIDSHTLSSTHLRVFACCPVLPFNTEALPAE